MVRRVIALMLLLLALVIAIMTPLVAFTPLGDRLGSSLGLVAPTATPFPTPAPFVPMPAPSPTPILTVKGLPPVLTSGAAYLEDMDTDSVLVDNNGEKTLPMASTTKIMTALLALQMGRLTDRIRVPKAAFNYEADATVMGLHPGQTVTLKDLLYGLMLPSGADAANTIAIHYGGSESRFVQLMETRFMFQCLVELLFLMRVFRLED